MKTFLIILCEVIFIILLIVLVAKLASCEQTTIGAEVKKGEVGQIYVFKATYHDGSERYFVVEMTEDYPWLREPSEKERANLHLIILRKWIWPNQIGE